MKKLLIFIMILSVFLVSCGSNDKNTTNLASNHINNIETNVNEVDNVEESNSEENTEASNNNTEEVVEEETVEEEVVEEETEEPVDLEGKVISKLTGLPISEEDSKKRPIVVMMDNHYKARPQSGLSEAEVVFEILAEGLITRYMAVIQVAEPKVIGPVRSARPYYLKRALEFNPLYVHVGGSMQAMADIVSYEMADVDGLVSGQFYREDHKNMPHNAYISHDGIRVHADYRGYYKEVEFEGLPIGYDINELNGLSTSEVKVEYKAPSNGDSYGYVVEFKYNEANKNYERYVNGVKHLDETTDILLTADNIIVQKVVHKTIDNEGRRELSMIGTGSGYYINRGERIEIVWEKTSDRGQTKYYLEDGSELILNPGITWVQVIKSGTEPYFK